MPKVLLINSSPHPAGCTARALTEMMTVFAEEGIETELVHIGVKDIRGCIGCNSCKKTGKCVFKDAVNETAEKFLEADGFVIGSPVYFASPNATAVAFMDRLFYSTPFSKINKVGAAVVSCRRGGSTASFDVLNKYFTDSGMPVAASSYWNQVHGFTAADVEKDIEGLRTMRNLARSMSYLIKALKNAEETYGPLSFESGPRTSFADGK